MLSDFHKREVDQEENVARSLPFFGPSLAVTATLLGIVAKSLPTFSLTDWYPASIYFILAILAASILVMLCYLWTAVRPRRFKIPLTAEEFYDTYQSFKAFYEGQNLSVAQRNAALISDLRLGLIRNYAEVATTNQKHTLARLNARARAFQCLIVVLFLAFCLVGVIIVHDQVLTPPKSAEPAPYYGID